ncbi:Di-sulfide bridge nucleocytoplasmic transport domain-containing protein [Syncephalis plumigaleata]|nr:Di-sulfide bridge nucleocytoplasmic transport domain-containing protein [Syncephalis plumigaleata]
MFYVAVETVRTDVQLKANERMAAIEESIRMCRANYENNICDDPNGRPLLADFCPGWKKCMEQDSSDFGRSRLVAEAAAEIIEAFMQPLSLRTILIFVLTAFGVLALLNIIYTIFTRNSNGHSSSTIAHPSSYPMLHPHPMHLEGPSGQKLRVQEVWHETEINHESYSDDDDDDDDDHEEHEDDYRHRHSSRHDQNPATMAMNRRRGRHRGRSSRSHSHSRSRSRSHSRTRTTIRYVNDNDY